ncbi:MAG: SdiA-regulated domain-containing protein [Xanthomonadales bacterium]|nr:SdiA-regulated domain-containing protein [Xanthomonadales bacterium]
MNISKTTFIFFLLLGFSGSQASESNIEKLLDYEVFPINTLKQLEPSGLTFKDGQLFTVCDDNNQIFRLEFTDSAEMNAVIQQNLDLSQLAAMNLDMEGITVAEDEFFVVSEVHHKLVRVNGDQLKWVPDLGSVYRSAYEQGLFQLYNAGLEAATYLGKHTFLLAVERQPRGLIEVKFNDDFSKIIQQTNQMFDDSTHPLESSRKPDLTGLYVFEGRIFALHRNAYVIHELIKNEQGQYQEGQSWSYEHIVKHPDYAYQDMMFGHAEGLAVDDTYFYLVLDNNGNPRLKNPNDNRPLLIRAKRK